MHCWGNLWSPNHLVHLLLVRFNHLSLISSTLRSHLPPKMKFLALTTTIFAAAKSVWTRGSPFAVLSALWATNHEGKYIIESEGIRLAFTNHGAAVTNLWINNTHGEEIDIVLGLDNGDDYAKLTSNPYLNGVIGTELQCRMASPIPYGSKKKGRIKLLMKAVRTVRRLLEQRQL